jgi:hypothetical protein
MLRYLSIALGVLVIVVLTIPEIRISDRFKDSNVKAEQFAKLLEDIPMEVGYWHGKDLPVEEQTRKTAGAVGYVSRGYRNIRTGEEVSLWLIVGHARDITAHTPEICYPASGFTKRADNNSLHPFIVEGQPPADFYTNTFVKEDVSGRQLVRVFWSWYRPNKEGNVVWEAPDNPRWTFGNERALYKMYFSNVMQSPRETTEQSPCTRFARDVLPVVNAALSAYGGSPPPEGGDEGGAPASESSAPAEISPAT